MTRDTREGWPHPTDETEAKGDSRSTNERDPSLIGSLGSSGQYNSFLYLPLLLVNQVQNIFSRRTLFHFICPHRLASWAGSRAESPFS
jgi:hypothetical protein